jgi:hypothetical protein
VKAVPKKKERRRRSTHLELLGGVSSDALRRIRETAARADLPLERVFRDVIAIGVSVVSDPQESPYHSLIAFRSGLASKQAELEDVEQSRVTPAVGPPFEGGNRDDQGNESVMAIPATDPAFATDSTQDGLDNDVERSGQWTEDEKVDAVVVE